MKISAVTSTTSNTQGSSQGYYTSEGLVDQLTLVQSSLDQISQFSFSLVQFSLVQFNLVWIGLVQLSLPTICMVIYTAVGVTGCVRAF